MNRRAYDPGGRKAGAIVKAWVENAVIYSVLEQVVWQQGLNHCYYMGKKHCNLHCFPACSLSFSVAGSWALVTSSVLSACQFFSSSAHSVSDV